MYDIRFSLLQLKISKMYFLPLSKLVKGSFLLLFKGGYLFLNKRDEKFVIYLLDLYKEVVLLKVWSNMPQIVLFKSLRNYEINNCKKIRIFYVEV